MSVISTSATIGDGTEIGEYCVIGDQVSIGANCSIAHHVVIHPGSVIGANVRIDSHTVIGKLPMKSKNSATTSDEVLEAAKIGDDCLIGAHVTVYKGCTLHDSILVADLATIREKVEVGKKTIVGRGVAIENQCSIGSFCKLETNVYITAYSTVGDHVFVAPGVLTSNDNFMGRTKERFDNFDGAHFADGSRIGVGAVILPGRTVGSEAVVAAGAVLTKNTEGEMIYAGIPAREFRSVPEKQKRSNQE